MSYTRRTGSGFVRLPHARHLDEESGHETWRADPTKTFYFGAGLGCGLTLFVLAVLLLIIR